MRRILEHMGVLAFQLHQKSGRRGCRGWNPTWTLRIMTLTSIQLCHSGTVEVVWVWTCKIRAPVKSCTRPANNNNGLMWTFLYAKSNGEVFKVRDATNKSPNCTWVKVKAPWVKVPKHLWVKVQTETTTNKSLTRKLRVEPPLLLDGGMHDFFCLVSL